ncbi:hypothetical protein [Actinomarinicola tropica]|uniref:PQQ-binding-like beta-propeller repeat protein n=1 Tax=Actinomarinicola tropica TaxID=2789776 RepID=A0A5Q2RCX5_9ACTN|nr:hypothetical protein [Actinomarinicola tropica]QGG94739.1 hypothetical protein GH723_06230 [Actinomarinicola tropica]
MATTPPTDSTGSTDTAGPATPPTDEGRPSWRAPAVLAGLVALVIVVVIAAMLVVDGDDGDSEVALVGLVDGELVRYDDSGQVDEAIAVDVDEELLLTLRPVGRHFVGIDGDDVIAIDSRTGEVTRYDGLEGDDAGTVHAARGSSDVAVVGRVEGHPSLVLVDLARGERIAVQAEGDDALFLPTDVIVSPDGTIASVVDWGAGRGDTDPTTLVDLVSGDQTHLPGYTAGLTDDRAVQRVVPATGDDDEPDVALQFHEHDGDLVAEHPVDAAARGAVLPDGTVLLFGEDGVQRLAEGDDEPSPLDAPDLGEIRFAAPMLDGSRVLVMVEDGVVLLDAEADELARATVAGGLAPARVDPDQRCAAFGFPGQDAVVIDLEAGDVLSDGSGVVAGYAIAEDRCAVVAEDGRITTTGGDTDGKVALPEGGGVLAVAPDGRAVVVRTPDGIDLVTVDGATERLSTEQGWFAYM